MKKLLCLIFGHRSGQVTMARRVYDAPLVYVVHCEKCGRQGLWAYDRAKGKYSEDWRKK